ncbi:hypothetical protein Bca4012_100134 [Brassica carinata]
MITTTGEKACARLATSLVLLTAGSGPVSSLPMYLLVWACRFLCCGLASVIPVSEPVKASGQARTHYSHVYVVTYEI